ncbi:MAG: hypothetical protein H0U76_04680 [Ktedonobacteraceae bacterium]|nr:hypothetical protein [Ktedonobacteraceae bacterium]
MSSNKKMWQETSRWIRVGMLSVSALSPFINILLARLRANIEAEEAVLQIEKDKLEDVAQSSGREINLDWQERLQAVGATVDDILLEIQRSSYGQKLQQQGENLRERSSQLSQTVAERGNDLKERSNQLSQAVVERGNQLTQSLAERGNDLKERSNQLSQVVAERSSQFTQDLADRGSKLTQDLAERGDEISQELGRRTRRARHELAGRDRNFWILLGFGTGLVATAVITYLFIRRRLQQAAEEEPPIQIVYNDTDATVENAVNGQPRGNIYSVGANGTTLEVQTTGTASTDHLVTDVAQQTAFSGLPASKTSETILPVRNEDADAASSLSEISGTASPADAAFIGVSSTKQYYPVETPLDQLHAADEETVDVIYFSSEDEAQRQGFSAATR